MLTAISCAKSQLIIWHRQCHHQNWFSPYHVVGKQADIGTGKVEEMSQQWVVWEIFSLTTHQTGSPYIFREYKTPLISDLREGEIRDWDNNN